MRLLCPWGFPGKDTGVGCHFLTPGGLSNPGTEPASPALAGGFSTTAPPEKPFILIRRDSKALSLPCEDMVRRWPSAARKGMLTRTHQPGTQTSDSQSPELRGNKSFLLQSPGLWYFVTAAHLDESSISYGIDIGWGMHYALSYCKHLSWLFKISVTVK